MTPPISSFAAITENARVRQFLNAPAVLSRVPRHMAIVVDARSAQHNAADVLRETIDGCLAHGITWLSVFVPASQQNSLHASLAEFVRINAGDLAQRRVQLASLGATGLRPLSDPCPELPSPEERLRVTLAFNYSGRAELVDAVRRLARDAAAGKIAASEIRHADLTRTYLKNMPPVDLLVRTGGETALSDFLLWQSAYTELLFVDLPWAQFSPADFYAALADYARRQRTFGALPTSGICGLLSISAETRRLNSL